MENDVAFSDIWFELDCAPIEIMDAKSLDIVPFKLTLRIKLPPTPGLTPNTLNLVNSGDYLGLKKMILCHFVFEE